MPVTTTRLPGGKYQVKTPNAVHAKGTSKANAAAQARLLNALDHDPAFTPRAKPSTTSSPRGSGVGVAQRRKPASQGGATVRAGGKLKFPIPDKSHARNALARLNQAKPPLTSAQKASVRARAKKVLGKATPSMKGR